MEVIPGSTRSNGNGVGVGKGGAMGTGKIDKTAKDTPIGRKEGNDGQEAVINVHKLKTVMPKAIKLEKDLADARTDASSAYKRWAKETGCNTAQLRAAAKAYANEEVEATRRKADQLSLIFVECGEQQ